MKIDLSNKAFENNKSHNINLDENKKANKLKNTTVESDLKKVEKNKIDKLSFFINKRFIPFFISNVILIFIAILLFVYYAFLVNIDFEIIQILSIITSVMSFFALIAVGLNLFLFLNKSDLEIEDGFEKTKYSLPRIFLITTFIGIFFIFVLNIAASISLLAVKENIANNFSNGMKDTLSIFCWFSIIFTISSIATNIVSFVLKD